MKIIKLFSTLLLLSTTATNAVVAIPQVAYAETSSPSEALQQSQDETATTASSYQLDSLDTTDQSSEEHTTESESTNESEYNEEEQGLLESEDSAAEQDIEEMPAEEVATEESADAETEVEEEVEVKRFDTQAQTIEITVENETQLRAILLGETYTDSQSTEHKYGDITNDQHLLLSIVDNLTLTEPISGIQRTNLTFFGNGSSTFTQATSADQMYFSNVVQLKWQGLRIQSVLAEQGLAQTVGASTITFEDIQLNTYIATRNVNSGRFVNNQQAHVQFKGINSIEAPQNNGGATPTLFTANRMTVEGQLTINHASATNTTMFEMNQVEVSENSNLSVTRTNNNNTGSVFNLIGTSANIDFKEGSQATFRQRGPVVSLPNNNQDSRLTISSGASLNVGTGQGLSGNSSSTLGEVILESGSRLKLSESGTVDGFPAINVGRRFVVADSSHEAPTIIEGNRSSTQLGAFIHLRTANSEVSIGSNTKMVVNQVGPVITASLADVIIGEGAQINATVGNGFTADTLIKTFQMKDGSEIILNERASNNSNVRRFYVRDSFITGDDVTLNSRRTTTTAAAFLELTGANARFISGNRNEMTIHQRGAIFTGVATTSELHFGTDNLIDLTSGRGLTGSTGATRRMIVGEDTKISVTEHTTNDNQHFVRLRDELILQDGAELHIKRHTSQNAEAIRLTRPNSKFTMGTASKLSVEVRGIAFYGTATTDVYIGDQAEIDSKASWGFTGRRTVRSFVTGKGAKIHHTEATSGNLTISETNGDSPFRVSQTFTLGEESEMTIYRPRNRADSGAIRVNSSNGIMTLKKNATLNIDLRAGGALNANRGGSFVMEDGAKFYASTSNGFNASTRRFSQMTIGNDAEFMLTDEGKSQSRSNSRPMIDVQNTITVGEEARFVVNTQVNRNEVIFFRNARANLNINGVQLFELIHPTMRAGNSRTTMQQLIRSANNTVANGLSINLESQKVSLWSGTQEAPDQEFVNISGVLRINRNSGNRPSSGAFTFNGNSQSRYISVQNADGTVESLTGADFATAISNNNYRRLAFSEPEGLVARIDPVSDQSTDITGWMYEDTDVTTITYTNLAGETVELDRHSPRIEWGDHRDEDQMYRHFRIPLAENERLETDTAVSIFLSKPSVATYEDITSSRTVIKGVEYNAYNVTLDRFKINDLRTDEDLHALLIEDSRAEAKDVLTEVDLTDDIRVIDTDVTLDIDKDGSYVATLEVGNKAYQFDIVIDVTSKLDHMRVTIPIKMVFESLYDPAESNRNFESPEYEIRNHSRLAVDTYINQMSVDDNDGIVLLEEGEDPLDYAESEDEEPILTLDDISTPLLRLSLKAESNEIQLYEQMDEQHLIRLTETSRVPISLTGDYYGDYPRLIPATGSGDDFEEAYVEDSLVPKYRIILRFVPRDES